MKTYDYTGDDQLALRETFLEMIDEIDYLRGELSEADDALVELYNEANDLERELHLLREHFDQAMFDAQEDYIALEQQLNALAVDYCELYDAAVEPVSEYDDEVQWDMFELTGITLN